MAKEKQRLSTAEFAKQVGISSSTVTQLIRDGKIKADKKSGKWMIRPDQLKAKAVKDLSKDSKTTGKKKTSKKAARKAKSEAVPPPADGKQKPAKKKKSFTVREFAERTYLTEWGVMEWLRKGRLQGRQDDQGQWQVDTENLEIPNVKRLVR